jgi:hypothetical protein
MAISPISSSIAREVFHTSLAGVGAKGVGSSFRVWDDRNAPDKVKVNTIKREVATLGMVSSFTAGIDWVGQMVRQKAVQNATLKNLVNKVAHHQTLIKAVPVSLGILMAEAFSRKLAPRNIWSEDGELNESILDSEDDKAHDEKDEKDEKDAKASPVASKSKLPGTEKKTPHPPAKRLPLTFAQASPPSLQYNPFPPAISPLPTSPLSNPFYPAVLPRFSPPAGL